MRKPCLIPFLFAAAASAAYAQPAIPKWNTLEASYADAGRAPRVQEQVKDAPNAFVLHFSFTGSDGTTATGIFIRPKAMRRYPVMLLMHGLGGNKDEITQRFVKPLLADDVAMLALDAPLHGERKTQKGNQTLIKMFFASQESRVKGDLMAQVHSMDPDNAYAKYFAGIVHGGVLDYRLALDYLATRSDVDMKHVGLFGESMGSIMGSILLGVDHRVDFAALAVGGDPALPLLGELPADLRDTVAETCPSLFIGHASGHPVFMLNGLQDDVIPKSATDRLFEAADQPKTIKWYAAKHFLPDQAFKDAEAWSVGLLKSQN